MAAQGRTARWWLKTYAWLFWTAISDVLGIIMIVGVAIQPWRITRHRQWKQDRLVEELHWRATVKAMEMWWEDKV